MISLYDCMNAIYPNGVDHHHVWCSKGHDLPRILRYAVDKNKPLVCRVCQYCMDCIPFDELFDNKDKVK